MPDLDDNLPEGHRAAAKPASFFTRRTLSRLAVIGFMVSILFLVVGTLWPNFAASPSSRACLILLISLTMSTYIWVLYPNPNQVRVEPKEPAGEGTPSLGWLDKLLQLPGVKLVGPLAVFVTMVTLLEHVLPGVPSTRYYELKYSGPEPTLSLLKPLKCSQRLLPVIENANSPRLLGFLALFEGETSFDATIEFEGIPVTVGKLDKRVGYEKQEVRFKPGQTKANINLEQLK